jgi:hypothetical protein
VYALTSFLIAQLAPSANAGPIAPAGINLTGSLFARAGNGSIADMTINFMLTFPNGPGGTTVNQNFAIQLTVTNNSNPMQDMTVTNINITSLHAGIPGNMTAFLASTTFDPMNQVIAAGQGFTFNIPITAPAAALTAAQTMGAVVNGKMILGFAPVVTYCSADPTCDQTVSAELTVPEPTTLLLLGIGLAGSLPFTRAMRSKSQAGHARNLYSSSARHRRRQSVA